MEGVDNSHRRGEEKCRGPLTCSIFFGPGCQAVYQNVVLAEQACVSTCFERDYSILGRPVPDVLTAVFVSNLP